MRWHRAQQESQKEAGSLESGAWVLLAQLLRTEPATEGVSRGRATPGVLERLQSGKDCLCWPAACQRDSLGSHGSLPKSNRNWDTKLTAWIARCSSFAHDTPQLFSSSAGTTLLLILQF